jgi:integrase
MASVSVTRRQAKSGSRWVVRYRLGGRHWPLVHAGSFRTLREARERRDFIAGEISAGRNPADALRALLDAPGRRTLADWADDYQASRVDYAARTTKNLHSHLRAILAPLGDRDPQTLTHADVQAWIGRLTLKPSSMRGYLATLRTLLDFADVDPNPARDPRVKLPRDEPAATVVPTSREVGAILAHMPERLRLPFRVLEQTGMRIGELQALCWGDVDRASCRFLIRSGKTAAARRWVAVPEWLLDEVLEACPFDDRTADRRVFQGFSADAAGAAMGRACKAAGIAHFHPHDLRHRYASVQIARGVPVTDLAAQLGHSKKSLTLDT